MRLRTALTLVALLVAGGGAAVALAAALGEDGRIGPAQGLVGNGRHLRPFGRLVRVGQFPTGGALTPNGRFYWTVSSGRGRDDVRIVSVRSGTVLQTLPLPGASGGIAMDPAHARAFVSGVADSARRDQRSRPGTPGIKGDVVHVFSYNPHTGSAKFERVIGVPPPRSATAPQQFPPTNLTQRIAWPDRLAASPDGSTLLVPLNLGDAAAIVDVSSGNVRYSRTGTYPYGAAILRDGHRGLVSNEVAGTVSVVDLPSGNKVKDIQVGPRLSHPEAIAVDPVRDRAYIALANSDQVVVIDTAKLVVERTLAVGRPEGLGASPVDVAVSPDGRRLLVADAGTDELLVFALPSFALAGRIPTAEYPADVEVAARSRNPCGFRTHRRRTRHAKRCAKLVYLSAKGLGTGPNPHGPRPNTPAGSDDGRGATQYLPLLNVGSAGLADFPTTRRLRRLTPVAEGQIRPENAESPPPDTPLRPGGPIKHVFYIVRENRTYDQILGDDPRGDGDPKLALFGGDTTPNAHALAQRFPLLDHVYANSEASIDGHYWAAAAQTPDYVHKNWFQNYANRQRPYDFGSFVVSDPPNGYLFDQATRQGISYFNFGEVVANVVPIFPDKDRTPEEQQRELGKYLRSDVGLIGTLPAGCYPNDLSIGYERIIGTLAGKQVASPVFDTMPPPGARLDSESRFGCFQLKFRLMLATNSVPAFTYMVLSNDHTQTVEAGARTPRAMIADNDEGLGRIVEEISHSPIWRESAIFVIEDDSQDGADHVDAHRIPAFAISPFAKAGAVVHRRYDMLSVIRSMELILGMKPLNLFDDLAVPMYDAFQPDASNAAPYNHVAAKVPLLETNPAGTPGARAAAKLPRCLDCIPQRDMDRLLWKSVHGWRAVPPPPGPNAEQGE